MRTKKVKTKPEVTQMVTVGSRIRFGLKEQDVQVLEPRSLKTYEKSLLDLGLRTPEVELLSSRCLRSLELGA